MSSRRSTFCSDHVVVVAMTLERPAAGVRTKEQGWDACIAKRKIWRKRVEMVSR